MMENKSSRGEGDDRQSTHGRHDAEIVNAGDEVHTRNDRIPSKSPQTTEDNLVELAPRTLGQDDEKGPDSELHQTTSHASTLPMSRARTIGMVTVSND